MNAPRAASGTSISEAELRRWAAAIETAAPGVVALPARIIGGRRWSILPGVAPRSLPSSPPERIALGGEAGLVLYGADGLDARARAALERAVTAGPPASR